MEEKVTGVMIYYYFVCKRKLWYFCHEIRMEAENEDVLLGKLLDESSYGKNEKHINIDNVINIDFIRDQKELHEVKKSRSMEEAGIMSPVLEISCQYRTMVHFDDHILIRVRMKAYNAIRMTLSYEMRDKATGELRAAGESSHCFLNREGHPVSLKRTYPTWDEAFQKAMATQNI